MAGDTTLAEFTVSVEATVIHQRIMQIMHNCTKFPEGPSVVKTEAGGLRVSESSMRRSLVSWD